MPFPSKDSSISLERPEAFEYAPYFDRYVSLVKSPFGIENLATQLAFTAALFRSLEEDYRPHEGKWTLKQVLGHCIDTERIMAYRALRIARKDATPLPSFDQDLLVENGPFETQELEDLLAEWEIVRKATLLMFRALDAEAWKRLGTASGNPMSARALAYIIAGHELHHAKLLEKYIAEQAQG